MGPTIVHAGSASPLIEDAYIINVKTTAEIAPLTYSVPIIDIDIAARTALLISNVFTRRSSLGVRSAIRIEWTIMSANIRPASTNVSSVLPTWHVSMECMLVNASIVNSDGQDTIIDRTEAWLTYASSALQEDDMDAVD